MYFKMQYLNILAATFDGSSGFHIVFYLMVRPFILDVTFSNFSTSCGSNDYIITSNEKIQDTQHPVDVSEITLYNVLDDNKMWIYRPDIG